MATLPTLTPEDRAAALVKAAQARKERAAMLAELKAGRSSVLDILDRSDDIAGRTLVRQVLESLPGVGKVRAGRHLIDLGISDTRRVQGLGQRQRERLIQLFPPQA
ncbi:MULTISPECIES: integration host factor, actinobacterial type [unclassified Streptomyces]|uniref:integration host factor, actinobacterial type n=1 Tax=unclassified Streptomyces TaxID=2593676 RepID=UPI002253E062|nr:integration host factor, actinobacterial type [Streptomyces sp. NBC_01443]MCX4633370.1 integration host factor [Streptomyces sp. NBC_01443]WSW49659.1 integration host factor [Streptomyces sp. NBC_01001]